MKTKDTSYIKEYVHLLNYLCINLIYELEEDFFIFVLFTDPNYVCRSKSLLFANHCSSNQMFFFKFATFELNLPFVSCIRTHPVILLQLKKDIFFSNINYLTISNLIVSIAIVIQPLSNLYIEGCKIPNTNMFLFQCIQLK